MDVVGGIPIKITRFINPHMFWYVRQGQRSLLTQVMDLEYKLNAYFEVNKHLRPYKPQEIRLRGPGGQNCGHRHLVSQCRCSGEKKHRTSRRDQLRHPSGRAQPTGVWPTHGFNQQHQGQSDGELGRNRNGHAGAKCHQ
jgi:hypothetical protein